MNFCQWAILFGMTVGPFLVGTIETVVFGTELFKAEKLKKPSWLSADLISRLFGPVWTFLYLSMGFASFLVWKLGGGLSYENIPPLLLYAIQLIFSLIWNPVFFGAGQLGGGLLLISATWAFIVSTIITFSQRSKFGAILLIPYFGWVTFAMILNYSLVCLNGCFAPTQDKNKTMIFLDL